MICAIEAARASCSFFAPAKRPMTPPTTAPAAVAHGLPFEIEKAVIAPPAAPWIVEPTLPPMSDPICAIALA